MCTGMKFVSQLQLSKPFWIEIFLYEYGHLTRVRKSVHVSSVNIDDNFFVSGLYDSWTRRALFAVVQ